METPANTKTWVPVVEKAAAIAPAVIGFAALGALKILSTRSSAATVMSIWGLVLFASFVGWGAAVNALTVPTRRFDLGMRAALGLAVHVALGGLLGALSLISKGAVIASAVGGLGCLGFFEWRERRAVVRSWGRVSLIATSAPLFALVMLSLLGATLLQYFDAAIPYSADFNGNDDGVAYFGFARQMLGSGTLIEPFSLRRIASLGGQTYLQASALVFGWVSQLHVVDRGLSLLLLCALIVGAFRDRPKTGRLAVVLALACVIALPTTRINTSSQMSGAALLFALYRLFSGRYGLRRGGPRSAVLVGLLVMTTCTLRQSYMLPAALLPALWWGKQFLAARGESRRLLWRQAGELAAASVALLLPWFVLSYRSDATFLFPLMKGNFRPDFGMLQQPGELNTQLQFLLKNVFYDLPVKSFGLFVLAGAIAVDRRPGRPLPTFVAAVVLGGFGLVRSFQLSDPPNLGRYFYALEVALVVAVLFDLVARASRPGRTGAALILPAALAVTAAGLYFMDVKGTLQNYDDRWLGALGHFADKPGPSSDETDPTYRALQQAVPPGEPLLVMLEAPYRFDFKRNRIINLDIPGAVSPSPGIPIFDGGEAVATYLQSKSIRYFAFLKDTTNFALYQRATWERQHTGAELIWRLQAPYYLAMFTDAMALVQTRKHVFEQGDLVVLDLATPTH